MKNRFLLQLCVSVCFFPLCAGAEPGIQQVLRLEDKPLQGNTLAWTGVAQLAWDELTRELGEDELRIPLLDGSPNPLAQWLNNFALEPKLSLPADCRSWAGMDTPEFLAKVKREVSVMFPGDAAKAAGIVPKEATSRKTLAIAALNHVVEFPVVFTRGRNEAGLKFTGSTGAPRPVHYFGTMGEGNASFGESVTVHSYRDSNHFAIELKAKSGEESVCILLWRGLTTLQEGITQWTELSKQKVDNKKPRATYLVSDDQVKIPCIQLDNEANFQPVVAGLFPTKRGVQHEIDEFKQWLNLRLDERGARIKAVAGVVADPFGGPSSPPPPRYFVCDEPFYVFLWRKDSPVPYAALRLDEGDWMKPWVAGESPPENTDTADTETWKNLQVTVEAWETSTSQAQALLEESSKHPSKLHGAVKALSKQNPAQAKLVELITATGRSGQRVKVESLTPVLMPMEMAVPEKSADDKSAKEPVEPVAEILKNIAQPADFEAVGVGSSLEIDPVLGDDGATVGLTFALSIVQNTGLFSTEELTLPDKGKVTISRIPKLHKMTISPSFTLKAGDSHLATTFTPYHPVTGRADTERRWLVFVRVDLVEGQTSSF